MNPPSSDRRLPAFPSLCDLPVVPPYFDEAESDVSVHELRVRLPRRSDDLPLSMPVPYDEFEEPSSPVSTMSRSNSIPISGGGMRRSASELKLQQDEEVADFRDYLMFCRIVDGISRKQQETHDLRFRQVNDMCLAHIIGTRNNIIGDETIPKTSLQQVGAAKPMALYASIAPQSSLRSLMEQSFQAYNHEGAEPVTEDDDEMFAMDL